MQSSIQNVLHLREKNERQRRMFSDAARGDDTLSITELHRLLADKLFFTDKDIAALQIDHTGDGTIDEYEFDAWFRSYNATEQKKFRMDMEKLTLGTLTRWSAAAGLVSTHTLLTSLLPCCCAPRPCSA